MNERISHHAFKRAQERLNMGRHSFADWCRATRYHWLSVNSEFLIARGIKATTHGCLIYVTPWTVQEGVALLVSNDGTVITIMTFPQTARLVAEAAAHPPVPEARSA
jgi:hypothetical protein